MADEKNDIDLGKVITDGFNDLKESIKNINVSRETHTSPPAENSVIEAIKDLKNTIVDMTKPKEDEQVEEEKVELPTIPEPENEEEEKNKPAKKHWLERIIRG